MYIFNFHKFDRFFFATPLYTSSPQWFGIYLEYYLFNFAKYGASRCVEGKKKQVEYKGLIHSKKN